METLVRWMHHRNLTEMLIPVAQAFSSQQKACRSPLNSTPREPLSFHSLHPFTPNYTSAHPKCRAKKRSSIRLAGKLQTRKKGFSTAFLLISHDIPENRFPFIETTWNFKSDMTPTGYLPRTLLRVFRRSLRSPHKMHYGNSLRGSDRDMLIGLPENRCRDHREPRIAILEFKKNCKNLLKGGKNLYFSDPPEGLGGDSVDHSQGPFQTRGGRSEK